MIRVNGEPIDPSLLEETFARLKAEAEALLQVSCCERDEEFRRQAEEEVIDGILLSQEAERRTPPPTSEEIRLAFEQTLRTWREHGASWDLLDAQRQQLRDETIGQLRMERFTAELWSKLPEPTEDDLRAFHREHAARYRTPPAARVLHLVRFPEQADPWDDYAAMLELRRLALQGDDFAELARTHTAKPDGEIDLGWIEQERVLNPFEAMLFSLQPGEISPVFVYEQALHLVKAVEVRPAAITPFEELADQILAEKIRHQRRQALQDLARELRQKALIERSIPTA